MTEQSYLRQSNVRIRFLLPLPAELRSEPQQPLVHLPNRAQLVDDRLRCLLTPIAGSAYHHRLRTAHHHGQVELRLDSWVSNCCPLRCRRSTLGFRLVDQRLAYYVRRRTFSPLFHSHYYSTPALVLFHLLQERLLA